MKYPKPANSAHATWAVYYLLVDSGHPIPSSSHWRWVRRRSLLLCLKGNCPTSCCSSVVTDSFFVAWQPGPGYWGPASGRGACCCSDSSWRDCSRTGQPACSCGAAVSILTRVGTAHPSKTWSLRTAPHELCRLCLLSGSCRPTRISVYSVSVRSEASYFHCVLWITVSSWWPAGY